MSKLLLFLYIILLTGYSHSQQWKKVVSGSFPTLYSIIFTDVSTAFAVGENGTIIKSTDGGMSWSLKISGTSKIFRDISFTSENIGYAIGDDRTIITTSDKGETWQLDTLTAVPDEKADMQKIYFENEQRGWIIASYNELSWILHTIDGGANWVINDTIDANLNDITFYNGRGIVTGNTVKKLYYTEDGVNWIKSSEPLNWDDSAYPDRSDVRAVFMTENLVYAVGYGGAGFPTIYLKSTDAGVTWEYMAQETEDRTYNNLYDVHFKDAFNGIAVGGSNTLGSLITKTSDGGLTWKRVPVPLGGSINSIFVVNDRLWICGSGGLLSFSNDFGDSWELVTIQSSNLYTVEFSSTNIGYAGGSLGAFFKTSDGGKTWENSYLYNGSSISEVRDLHFLDENLGFSAHRDMIVSKTTNGGLNWNILIPGLLGNTASYSIFFINENVGFVAGQADISVDFIYSTTDNGNTWIMKDSLAGKELKCIKFFDDMHGVAAGNGMKIIYTTDGGVNWNIPDTIINTSAKKDPNLNTISYCDQNTIYAAGASVLFRSTDGGATWDYVDLPEKKTWNSIKFQDSTLGYMVGANYIMKTTDSGYSWNNISDSVITGTLYDIDIDDDGFVWVCGNNSSIYTNKNFTSSIAVNELPLEFQIAQNYPNPFNPSTTIVYSIPVQGMVEFKVFDMLGQEVKTLVNEIQQGGTHRVSFNAGNLSSGIYFYTIKYNNLLQSRKMTLIK